MDPVGVRDITADGNARIHVGHSSVTHVHNYVEAQESAPAPFSLIPFSRDPDFVTRGDILDHVAAQCAQPGGRAALVGLGGVGKSQLAIEYAYQTTDKCHGTWVFWVHGGTRGRVEEGFRAIADAVKLPGRHLSKANIPQLLHTWLSNERNGKWHMIIDSADDHDVFYGAERGSGKQPLASYLPQSPNGSILVTTRDHGFAFRLTGNFQSVIKVGPMEPEEAVSLLEKKLGAVQTALAGELVTTLDCIPLAINQAASYIQARSPRCTIEKYLREFGESERNSAKLMAHDSAELRRDGSASNAIMKTWQISFDHIRSKQPSAADLLSLMSFFDHQSIPEAALNPEDEYDSDFDSDLESNCDGDELANQFSALHLIAAKNRRNKIPSCSDLGSDSGEDNNNFEDDVSTLCNFCLISVNESGTEFEMHRLVQLATKKWLAAAKQHERFKQLFIHRVYCSMPAPTPSQFITYRDYVVHMQIALRYRPNKANTRAWCTIGSNLSWLRHSTGRLDDAREPLDKVYAVWKERKGAEHEICLEYRTLLGDILLDLNQIVDAERIINEVLEIQKRTLGEDDRSTLMTMASLAEIHLRQGSYAEAERLESQATEMAKRTLGSESRTTIWFMLCLSRTLTYQRRLKEAEEIYSVALDISKRVFGPACFETLELMALLVETYRRQQRHGEALKLELELLKLAKAHSRPNNLVIADSMARLSSMYSAESRHTEAEEMGKAALALSTADLGPSHPSTLDKLIDLADRYQEQGRNEEANTILVEALTTARSAYGPDHTFTITCMESAFFIFSKMDQYDQQVELQTHILAYRRRTLGNTHLDTIRSIRYQAGIFEDQGKFEESVALYREALSVYEAKFGFEHRDTLQIAIKMTSVYIYQLQRHSEVFTLLESVCQASRVVFGAENEVTLRSMRQLSLCQTAAGFFEDAEKLQRDILAGRTSTLGARHTMTISAIDSLGEALADSGKFEEAAEQFREALAGYKTHSVARTKSAGLVAESLGRVYLSSGHYDDALEAFAEAGSLFEAEEGENGPSVLGSVAWKGIVYRDQERWSEALEVFWHVFETRKSVLGPDDRVTVMSMRCIAVALSHSGEFDKAVALMRECIDRMRQLFGSEDPDTLELEAFFADALEDDDDDDDENTPDSSALEDGHTRDQSDIFEAVGEECEADVAIEVRSEARKTGDT